MIKAVIFDLWNTLIEPTDDYHTMKTMKKLFDIPDKVYHEKVKKGLMTNKLETMDEILGYMKKEFNIREPRYDDIQEIKKVIKRDSEKVRPYYDAKKTLQDLKAAGIKTALISNAASFHKSPLYDFGLDKYFDHVIFSCDVGYWKPDPEIYQLALNKLGVSAYRTIMTGDHVKKDYWVPSRMDIKGIHLNRELTKEYNHPIRGYKTEIKSLYEIMPIIGDLQKKQQAFREKHPERYESWCNYKGY
ncbi:MAG: HAD family hydrolase [archaeon]